MKIYVEDSEGKVVFATEVEVNGSIEDEPICAGVAKMLEIKRCLVAAAGIELGADWWKEDKEEEKDE